MFAKAGIPTKSVLSNPLLQQISFDGTEGGCPASLTLMVHAQIFNRAQILDIKWVEQYCCSRQDQAEMVEVELSERKVIAC